MFCLSDSDASNAASVATTRSAQSVRGIGLAASAEDQCLGLDARRNVPDHFVHRSMAAAVDKPLRRRELHPPNPFIAIRQVRRSDLLHVMYLCIRGVGRFRVSRPYALWGSVRVPPEPSQLFSAS